MNHEQMVRLRARKVAGITREIPPTEVFGPADGDLLVVGWGGTYGAHPPGRHGSCSGAGHAGRARASAPPEPAAGRPGRHPPPRPPRARARDQPGPARARPARRVPGRRRSASRRSRAGRSRCPSWSSRCTQAAGRRRAPLRGGAAVSSRVRSHVKQGLRLRPGRALVPGVRRLRHPGAGAEGAARAGRAARELRVRLGHRLLEPLPVLRQHLRLPLHPRPRARDRDRPQGRRGPSCRCGSSPATATRSRSAATT